MYRPTKKAFSLTLGALLLFGVGANAEAGWLYVMAAAMVGVVIAGLIIPATSLRKLTVSRRVPARATAGDDLTVILTIENHSKTARRLIAGNDGFLGANDFVAPMVAPLSSLELRTNVSSIKRGIFSGAPLTLRSGVPFGIAIASRKFGLTSELTVHPRWFPIQSFPLLEAASTPDESWHERPRRGGGMDFYGLREYRPGDSVRHIHWRNSAKGGKLLVREYEEQPSSRLTIIIDNSVSIGGDPANTLEDSISIAASLVMYAMQSGHPVQLFAIGAGGDSAHLFEPTRSQALDWLSSLQIESRGDLARLATEASTQLFRRSTNVLIFPSTGPASASATTAVRLVQRRAARVIGIVLDASSYDPKNKLGLSRDQLSSSIESLKAAHCIVYPIDKDKGIAQCLRMPLAV
ncbi:MAG: DUF58 domain-containing protein [Actinobacteria bacterium]|nr:DUF58 domain-containing protein [Actinomycetota bacterium]